MRRKYQLAWLLVACAVILLLVRYSSEIKSFIMPAPSREIPATTTLKTDSDKWPTATASVAVLEATLAVKPTEGRRTPGPSAGPTVTAVPAPTLQTMELTPVAGISHPYLLFNRQELTELRQDIVQTGNSRRELFLALEDHLLGAGESGEVSNLLITAFFALVTDNKGYFATARDLLMNKVSEDCWDTQGDLCQRDRDAANTLAEVSLAYDWLHPFMSPSERDRVKARIGLEVCRYYEAFTYGSNNTDQGWNNWWMTDYSQNHFHSVTGGMVLGALAIQDDTPPACQVTDNQGRQSTVTNQAIVDFGLEKMTRNYLLFDQITDGSYPEGDSYATAYSETYWKALWAVSRLLPTGLELVKEKRLQMFPLFYLFNSIPGRFWQPLTNHGDYYVVSRANYHYPRDLRLVATLHRNELANWLARQYYYDRDGKVSLPVRYGHAADNLVMDLVFTDPALGFQAPAAAQLDLSYHAADWEGVFMRSDWSDQAVAAAIKVGPPGGHAAYNVARSNHNFDRWVGGGQEPTEFDLNTSHMHADANGIYLAAGDVLLLPEMAGYAGGDTPWGAYTSSHNTIMVSDDQGRMRGQLQGDDVGGASFGFQRRPGQEYFWEIETPERETGIIEHFSGQGYDYSLGQATGAYWPELNLTRFHRHLLFVRQPGYLFVVDDLEAAAVKTFDWMGHSTGLVVQEGQWLKVNADNDQRLGVAVLSPSSFEFPEPVNEWGDIQLQDVSAFRFISESRGLYEWRIRQDCQACRFLTLLFPTAEKQWSQKPSVTRLADTDQLAAVEVNFADTKRVDTLAISLTPGQLLTAGDLTFDGRSAAVEQSGSKIRRALLVQGSSLTYENIDLIRDLSSSSKRAALHGREDTLSFIEVLYNDDALILRSIDPTGVTLFAPGVSRVIWQRVDENNVITSRPVPFDRDGSYITVKAFN